MNKTTTLTTIQTRILPKRRRRHNPTLSPFSMDYSSFYLLILSLLVSSTYSILQLQGKRILVTGAGRGVGRAIALICYEEGANVAISSRTQSELKETMELATAASPSPAESSSSCSATNNNNRTTMHLTDITNPIEGGLDILINNVGGAQQPKGPVNSLDSNDSTRLLQLNVVGTHIVTSTVLRLAMKKNQDDDDTTPRTILNISSKAGKVGLENNSLYVASKFALERMTSSWSKELKTRNISVHSISPGMINTKSFPKPPGRKGVRAPGTIRDCLLLTLTSGLYYTGHYIHVDELDMVRSKGLPDTAAWKPIDEPSFQDTLEK